MDAIELAIANITDGSAVNIDTGQPTSFLDIISILSTIAGYQPDIKTSPEKPLGVFSRFGQPDLAAEKIGWRAKVSLNEGLRRVYDFVHRLNGENLNQ